MFSIESLAWWRTQLDLQGVVVVSGTAKCEKLTGHDRYNVPLYMCTVLFIHTIHSVIKVSICIHARTQIYMCVCVCLMEIVFVCFLIILFYYFLTNFALHRDISNNFILPNLFSIARRLFSLLDLGSLQWIVTSFRWACVSFMCNSLEWNYSFVVSNLMNCAWALAELCLLACPVTHASTLSNKLEATAEHLYSKSLVSVQQHFTFSMLVTDRVTESFTSQSLSWKKPMNISQKQQSQSTSLCFSWVITPTDPDTSLDISNNRAIRLLPCLAMALASSAVWN